MEDKTFSFTVGSTPDYNKLSPYYATRQDNPEPYKPDTPLVKPTQFQELYARQVAWIGDTFRSLATPAIYPMSQGNIAFDYGVKTGERVAEIGGEAIGKVITDVKEKIATTATNIGKSVQSGVFNLVIVLIFAAVLFGVIKKAVSI